MARKPAQQALNSQCSFVRLQLSASKQASIVQIVMQHKSLKLFISYCHSDSNYLNEFKKHLITLKRKGILNVWSDIELVSGDKLHEEIPKHLSEANLVAFLVSVDFLNSWYCFDMELKTILEKASNDNVRIIPIIVRSCMWQETTLGQYRSATRDGKPIANYSNQDDAWIEVVKSIEEAANKYAESDSPGDGLDANRYSQLDAKFIAKLQDTEVQFQNKYKDQIVLEDIFVYPDLKNLKKEYDEIDKTVNSRQIANLEISPKKILVLGSEQSGKTSLAKSLFSELHKQGYLPLLWDGVDVKTTNVRDDLNKLVSAQYVGLNAERYLLKSGKRILIIDDYHKLKLNVRYQSKFLDNLNDLSDKIILLSDSNIKYDEDQFLKLSDYLQYEILPFGHVRRGELIEKWNSIGRIETINIKELQDQSDDFTRHVDSIIRKNILPPKPIYVLTVIQLLDTSKPSDYSLTSYGHCYQSLIQAALKRSNIATNEFDTYINYLSEFAYYVFRRGAETIDVQELEIFKSEYSHRYLIESHEDVMAVLSKSGVIYIGDNSIRFSYRYIFYFYVAKYLADHINAEECKREIKNLFDKLHTEKNANVLIFLVHHTKDKEIIKEILTLASAIFEKTNIAKLDQKDTQYLIEYLASIPQLVLEQRNIEQERKKQLEIQDKYEESENNNSDLEESDSARNVLSEINRSVRLVEIIGQILRNRHGSLTKDQLKELALAAYSSGLKFLNYFLTSTRENHELILKHIEDLFRKNTSLKDEEISDEARKIFLMICYGVSYSVVKKIANSIGSEKLITIFKAISRDYENFPTYQLVYIAIELEFMKKIPRNEIEQLYNDLESNPIARRLLQEIVIQHLYLNHVDYKDRQWISNKLKLPMASQRLLQGQVEHKK